MLHGVGLAHFSRKFWVGQNFKAGALSFSTNACRWLIRRLCVHGIRSAYG